MKVEKEFEMSKDQDYQKASDRVEAKMGFYVHLTVYVLVNTLLVVINYAKSPDNLWFYWVIGGWGIGIVMHAWKVFGNSGLSDIKQQMIEKELDKIHEEESEDKSS